MPRKGGAPRKAPKGLQRVLYVRVSAELIKALDRLAAERNAAHPGHGISRADVTREILRKATGLA